MKGLGSSLDEEVPGAETVDELDKWNGAPLPPPFKSEVTLLDLWIEEAELIRHVDEDWEGNEFAFPKTDAVPLSSSRLVVTFEVTAVDKSLLR